MQWPGVVVFYQENQVQTHENRDSSVFLELLRQRAAESVAKGDGTIAAGAPGEEPLAAYKASNGVHVRLMPDDPQGILRISIGGGDKLPVTMNYCTVRGDIWQCIELLEKAVAALRETKEYENQSD